MKEQIKCYCGHTITCDCGPEEPKQETTLEEAGVAYAKTVNQNHTSHMLGFSNGAKWEQERILDFLYSEITERRDYSASKMCEVIIEFIKNDLQKN